MIDVPGRRAFVGFAKVKQVSVSRACELVKVSRRRLGYVCRKNDAKLVARLKELALKYPRSGVRQLRGRLLVEGLKVNLKRVRRLCRKYGLMLKQKRRRKRLGIGIGMPCKAEYPNQVWAYDFVEDRTDGRGNRGRKLRILTVIDEFTRECIELEVEHRMNAKLVAMTLLRLFKKRRVPKFIRSDNGPEFIAQFLMRVFAIHRVLARHIDPGSPWQNGIDERFNGTLRRECLDLETFHNRDHARALIKLYGREYNHRRPHSSLKYLTPAAFAKRWREQNGEVRGDQQCDASGVPLTGEGSPLRKTPNR